MPAYTVQHIASVMHGNVAGSFNGNIEHLLIDSRRVVFPAASLFFAIASPLRDGHRFIDDAYQKGIRAFVISKPVETSAWPEASFIRVANTITALQELAAHHRRQFSLPVIGITGSNGKTIVKEWLFQLLQEDYKIVRSPRSYNSQIGVPLSVWQLNKDHTLAIFEAGISQPGEMEKLQAIIQPSAGVITSIGEAHSEGFTGRREKINEKTKLLKGVSAVVFPQDTPLLGDAIEEQESRYTSSAILKFNWGHSNGAALQVKSISKAAFQTTITCTYQQTEQTIIIPFTDDASIENALTCWSVLLLLQIPATVIAQRMLQLQPVNMRLEMKKAINNCTLINDSYSADITSLQIALNFLQQQSGTAHKTVILSDFLQTGAGEEPLYKAIADALVQHEVKRVIGIGEKISHYLPLYLDVAGTLQEYHASTEKYLRQFRTSSFREETILIKGARVFELEQIAALLEQKAHQTILEINLDAIVHNFKQYQQCLVSPHTKIMAMVKAFAYGSGGAEIAGVLQYHKCDYLGVAYADEGVDLRKAGIRLPVMVMNPEETSFAAITDHNLEPDIYSFHTLYAFEQYLKQEDIRHYPVHIEIETGMNRLGFSTGEVEKLASYLSGNPYLNVQSVFSHLASSEEPGEDAFTQLQYERFAQAAAWLETKLGYSFLKHISNSAAIIRQPALQLDMVRLGIGLYGVDSAATGKAGLQPAATLKSTVSQIKHLQAGDSVSYNRKGKVDADTIIATIRIGYADGYPRRLGYGNGYMLVNGQPAPTIGTVCMDMTMINITGIPGVQEGDEVIVFGDVLPIQEVAARAGTIPYEIMTGISQRVKRVYFQE